MSPTGGSKRSPSAWARVRAAAALRMTAPRHRAPAKSQELKVSIWRNGSRGDSWRTNVQQCHIASAAE